MSHSRLITLHKNFITCVKIGAMTTIEPMPGVILVELPASEFGDVPTIAKSHDSMTYGKVLAMHELDKEEQYLLGRVAYWRKYKDDARIPHTQYALIEISDILGSSYDTESAVS